MQRNRRQNLLSCLKKLFDTYLSAFSALYLVCVILKPHVFGKQIIALSRYKVCMYVCVRMQVGIIVYFA